MQNRERAACRNVSQWMLSSLQNDYFSRDICPREPLLHRRTVQNLELPQRFLYALGALFVDETVRK